MNNSYLKMKLDPTLKRLVGLMHGFQGQAGVRSWPLYLFAKLAPLYPLFSLPFTSFNLIIILKHQGRHKGILWLANRNARHTRRNMQWQLSSYANQEAWHWSKSDPIKILVSDQVSFWMLNLLFISRVDYWNKEWNQILLMNSLVQFYLTAIGAGQKLWMVMVELSTN